MDEDAPDRADFEPLEEDDPGLEGDREADHDRRERLSPAEWFEELLEELPELRHPTNLLFSTGVPRVAFIELVRELEGLRTPYNRSSLSELKRLIRNGRAHSDALAKFFWSDGYAALHPQHRPEADELMGLSIAVHRAATILEKSLPGFQTRLLRERQRPAKVLADLTLLVDRHVKPKGKVTKSAQHEALSAVISGVTEATRSRHAQRVSTARLKKARGIKTVPKPKKAARDDQRHWQRDVSRRKGRRPGWRDDD